MKKEKRHSFYVVSSTIDDCFKIVPLFNVKRFSSKAKALSFARQYFYRSLVGFYLRDKGFIIDVYSNDHFESGYSCFYQRFSSSSRNSFDLTLDFYVDIRYVSVDES